MTLRQFLKTDRDRGHVRQGDLEVYVRRTKRLLANADTLTLTVADFTMLDGSDEETAFVAWYKDAEQVCRKGEMSIAFENVGGWPWMEKFLAERGYFRGNDPGTNPSQLDAFRVYRDHLTRTNLVLVYSD